MIIFSACIIMMIIAYISKRYAAILAPIILLCAAILEIFELNTVYCQELCMMLISCSIVLATLYDTENTITIYIIYAAVAMATIANNNLFLIIIYWEIMFLAATAIVSKQKNTNIMWYVLPHALSGVCLICGAVGQHVITNDYSIHNILDFSYIYQYFLLIGILINCAAWPMSFWVVKCYNKATKQDIIPLSSFTTKASIIVLLRIFHGNSILIYVGMITLICASICAFFEKDTRKVLCHIMVYQLGIMIVGIGIDTKVAIAGAIFHASSCLIYQCLLLMTIDAPRTDPKNKMSAIPAMIAAAASTGLPLTSGFTSKSLAIGELHHISNVAWILCMLSGAIISGRIVIKYLIQSYKYPTTCNAMIIILSGITLALGVIHQYVYKFLGIHATPYTISHIIYSILFTLILGICMHILYQKFVQNLTFRFPSLPKLYIGALFIKLKHKAVMLYSICIKCISRFAITKIDPIYLTTLIMLLCCSVLIL